MSRAALVNFDNLFAHSKGNLITRDLPLMNKQVVADFIKMLFSSQEELSFVASCECGHYSGSFYEGKECPKCNSVVAPDFHNAIEYKLWLEFPEFCPPVIHPRAYTVLKNMLKKYKGFELLDLLIWTEVGELPKDLAAWYTPSWQNFYTQFDKLMLWVTTSYPPFLRKENKCLADEFKRYIAMNRAAMFVSKVPILNSSCHQITSSGDLKYIDKASQHMVELIVDISQAQHKHQFHKMTEFRRNKTISRIYKEYQTYLDKILTTMLIGDPDKKGNIRHSGMGIRCHWSFRGVIVPITEDHEADEIHMPWSVMVKCFELQILNLLTNRCGLSYELAIKEYNLAVHSHSVLVHNILNILIAECPFKGLPMMFNRNPSMHLGALQLFFITKVLLQEAIGISDLDLKAQNADFDGDEMNGYLLFEMDEVKKYFFNIHPSMMMYSIKRPGIGTNICVSDQKTILLQNWLLHDD